MTIIFVLFLTNLIVVEKIHGIGLFADIQAFNYGSATTDFNANVHHSGRSRRSLETSKPSKECQNKLDKEAEKKILAFQYPLRNDHNMDLQLVYLGPNSETQVLMTSMAATFVGFFARQHKSSNLYQSTDGGRTFQLIMDKIGSASIRQSYGVLKSPVDHSRVILVSYTPSTIFGLFSSFTKHENSVILISENSGKNFTSVKLPFRLRENEPLIFNPKKKDWIIALEKQNHVINIGIINSKHYGQAWISKDFGRTWKEMMKGHIAASVKWGAAKEKEGEEIYLATHIKQSIFSLFRRSSTSSLTLWKSADGGRFFEEIIEHCYNFGVEGDFVFASVIFKSSITDIHQKRILHVSKDSGNSFHSINMPEITADKFYAVLEMHKGMIFLHIDDSSHPGKGTLFISGSDGLMFTKSLANHFYTNHGFTDFTRINSMHGVYITQVLQDDNTLKSVISFDRGMIWKPIYVDKKIYCKDIVGLCTLHFHKDYSRVNQRIDVQPPLSSANAPGLIFMHGQAGDALTGTAQVWFSRNGGYNWTKVADTPHHYSIGDNGNLLVIVPRLNNTGNVLLYSIDQGRCWHRYKFSSDNQELVIRGLVTEPHGKQRTFSLWGYYKNALPSEKEWIVVTLSFKDMFSKKCSYNDFVEWSPHVLNKKSGCFLGEKLFYRKPKPDAKCYIGKDYDPLLRTELCDCDKDDLECDYGFERQPDGTCKENKSIKPIEVCKKGEKMKEKFSKGYRRVPGDVCKSEKAVDDVVKYIDEHVKCTPSKDDIFGVITEEKEYERNHAKIIKTKENRDIAKKVLATHRSKGHRYFIVIAILVVIGIVLGSAWYGLKYIKSRRSLPTTVFSQVDDDVMGSIGDMHYDPRPKSERQYRDETDAEDDDLLIPV